MLTNIQLKSVEVASSSEPTPELASFWQQKYRDLYLDKTFFLDQATEELIGSTRTIKEFRPPRGYINLPEHILNGKLDTDKLEKTVEIAIRYLDDVINKLQLVENAQKIASNYRAIKVSIQGLEIYLDKVQPLATNEEIKKLGFHIANTAYRASESLAEEKGSCLSWKKYCKPHKIRAHDMLYNTVTEEAKMYTDFAERISLEGSDWQVYQRRNLTLLDFPKNSSWQQLDDYAEQPQTKPKLERTPFKAVEVSVENSDIATISETLHASPYKKLFNSLLDDESNDKAPSSSANIKTPESPMPVVQPAPVERVVPDQVNESTMHIVVLLGDNAKQAGIYSVKSYNTDQDISAMCQKVNDCKVIHAFVEGKNTHIIYETLLNNLKNPLKLEFHPIPNLKIEGRPIEPHLNRAEKGSNLPQTVVQNKLILNSHFEEYNLQTTYFGRVFFTVEYINGLVSGISGSLEKNQAQASIVFNFLSDTLNYSTREGIPISKLIADLETKKNNLQSRESLKPLILATHILKIIHSKHIQSR